MKKIEADGDSGDLRHRVAERHAIARHVPPAVGGGEAQRQREEHARRGTPSGCATSASPPATPAPWPPPPSPRLPLRTVRSDAPTWWGEHQEEHGAEDDAHQRATPGRAATPGTRLRRNMMNIAVNSAQRGDQETELAATRDPSTRRQDQVVVAQVLRCTTAGWARSPCESWWPPTPLPMSDRRTPRSALTVPAASSGSDQRPGADDAVPLHQDSQNRPAAGQQRSDRDQIRSAGCRT